MDIEFHVDDDTLLPRSVWQFLVKLRADWMCERCNEQPERRLQAHHKDENKVNHRLSNGECLCLSCHAKHHVKGHIATIVAARKASGEPWHSAETRAKIGAARRGKKLGPQRLQL